MREQKPKPTETAPTETLLDALALARAVRMTAPYYVIQERGQYVALDNSALIARYLETGILPENKA